MDGDWRAIHALRMRRHWLDTSERPDPADVAYRVGGLQAQVASVPAVSVLARNGETAPDGWKSLVRMWTLRGTLHLVRAEDVHLFAAALGDSTAARETRLWPRHGGVPASAEDSVTSAVLSALGDVPLDRHTIAERVGDDLGPGYQVLLEHPWGIGFKPAVARGLLRMDGTGTGVRFSRPDFPFVGTVDAATAQEWLARVYLTANVVGDAASFAAWTGLPRPVARNALRAATDAQPPAKPDDLADADAVALVPTFDPYTLAVADKDGFCPPGTTEAIYRRGGWVSPVVLHNGLPVGLWSPPTQRTKRIVVEPFGKLPASVDRRVRAEVDRFSAYFSVT